MDNFMRHLIGALRGGHETTIDRSGKKTDRYFTPGKDKPKKPFMPTGLRQYQLHNQEASVGLHDKKKDY